MSRKYIAEHLARHGWNVTPRDFGMDHVYEVTPIEQWWASQTGDSSAEVTRERIQAHAPVGDPYKGVFVAKVFLDTLTDDGIAKEEGKGEGAEIRKRVKDARAVQREMRTATAIQQGFRTDTAPSHVIEVVDVVHDTPADGQTRHTPFFVMPKATPWDQYLRRLANTANGYKSHFPVHAVQPVIDKAWLGAVILRAMRDAARGLREFQALAERAELHRVEEREDGPTVDVWAHRDIKPGNLLVEIFVDADGSHWATVKVADFGHAKELFRPSSTEEPSTVHDKGTASFRPPEGREGAGASRLDGRSDVYSLALSAVVGHTLYIKEGNLKYKDSNGYPVCFSPDDNAAISQMRDPAVIAACLGTFGESEPADPAQRALRVVVAAMLHPDMDKRPTPKQVAALLDEVIGDVDTGNPVRLDAAPYDVEYDAITFDTVAAEGFDHDRLLATALTRPDGPPLSIAQHERVRTIITHRLVGEVLGVKVPAGVEPPSEIDTAGDDIPGQAARLHAFLDTDDARFLVTMAGINTPEATSDR